MLEVRYKPNSGEITAWAGSPGFTGGHLEPREGEEIIVLDCPTPSSMASDYLIIDGELVRVNEPEPPRDLVAEIDVLTARVEALEQQED